ncbi:MAG: GFA family protein [Kiloniellales bacterium]|nr:GFA family protein [Kiloniellales bacterium]
MDWTGGCLCGAIRYRATAAPLRAMICHCETCRRVSGSAFLSFVHFAKDRFTWESDEPTRYRSSAYAERGFCPTCGSTLSMHEEVLGDRVQVSLGSLDRPEDVAPEDHVWTQSQLPWLEVADDLPRFPQSSDAVPSRALEETWDEPEG